MASLLRDSQRRLDAIVVPRKPLSPPDTTAGEKARCGFFFPGKRQMSCSDWARRGPYHGKQIARFCKSERFVMRPPVTARRGFAAGLAAGYSATSSAAAAR